MILRKSILFYYCLCCFNCLIIAQSPVLSVSPNSLSKEVIVNTLDPNFEDISTIRLTNNSDQNLKLRWTKEVEHQPREWRTRIYGKKDGFVPYSGKIYKEHRTFTLKAGKSTEYYLVLQPNNKSGKGRIKLSFSTLTKPTTALQEVVFNFNVVDDSRAKPRKATTKLTRIYPNPAGDNFFVELPAGIKAGKVEVINTLGRKLKTFALPDPKKGYSISELPEGIYLINIYDSSGAKLRTLRLLHRRFGA